MLIKAFELNKNGKIELTPKELENLMKTAYMEGQDYERNKNNRYTYWNYPYSINGVVYDSITSTTTGINGDIYNDTKAEVHDVDALSTKANATDNLSIAIEGVANSATTAEASFK